MKRRSILMTNMERLQAQGEVEAEKSLHGEEHSNDEKDIDDDDIKSGPFDQFAKEKEEMKETDMVTQIINSQHLSKQAIIQLGKGLLSDQILQKISAQRVNPEAIRILSSIELNHIDVAREIALNPQFIEENKNFLEKGTATKAAIEKGHQNFANELIEVGYLLPGNLLLDAIRDEDDRLIKRIIEGNFYNINNIKLDF